jgi:hypothetical protein
VDTSAVEHDLHASSIIPLDPRPRVNRSPLPDGHFFTWYGVQPEGSTGHSRLTFAPFVPGPRIIVGFMQTQLPADAATVESWPELFSDTAFMDAADRASADDFAALREVLAATCGIAPKGRRALDIVELLVWYAPVAGRTEADLTEPQKALLAAYDAGVAKELAARAANAPSPAK